MKAAHDAWKASLAARAHQLPLRPRLPLATARGRVFGSVEDELALQLAEAGLGLSRQGEGWTVQEPLAPTLHAVAAWLSEHGLCGRWRDELLEVTEVDSAARLSVVERAAVRPLGITSFAVHLVGFTPEGRVWVQQRALDKATDPGLWDTLVGGLRAAGESVRETLARETFEEAGLRLDQLRELRPAGQTWVRRPVREGYMVEHIDIFHAVLPEGVTPENRDGEVAGFDCLERSLLHERLRADAFTLEAALMMAPL